MDLVLPIVHFWGKRPLSLPVLLKAVKTAAVGAAAWHECIGGTVHGGLRGVDGVSYQYKTLLRIPCREKAK